MDRTARIAKAVGHFLRKGSTVVYCNNCQSARLDGPEFCPRCGDKLIAVSAIKAREKSVESVEQSATTVDNDLPDEIIREGELAGRCTTIEVPQSRHVWIRYKGEKLSARQWAERTGLSVNTINYRIAAGYTPAQIFAPESFRKDHSYRLRVALPTEKVC